MPKTRTSYIVLNKIDYLKKDFFWKLTLFKTHMYVYRNQNEAVDEEIGSYNSVMLLGFVLEAKLVVN